jgi:hypothetical protein
LSHLVRLVYPIAKEKWIVRKTGSGKKVIGRRRSPKFGRLSDLSKELVSIPDLINHDNQVLKIALIQEEEIRHADGGQLEARRTKESMIASCFRFSRPSPSKRKKTFSVFFPTVWNNLFLIRA